MARKTHQIKKWLPCPLWDFAGLQDWLNEQAQAGYALEKWPGFWFIGRVIFRKDSWAVHARYCLDPIQEHFGIAKLREQEAGYQELGWHYVDKIQNYYAIYRCDDPQAPDLYTDLESLSWAMKKQAERLMLMVRFHSSALIVSALSSATMPAQLIRISTCPNAFTAASITFAG